MADLEISYKGNKIVELSETGTKTLQTAGKYCEDDIEVSFTKSGGYDNYQYGGVIQSPVGTDYGDNDTLTYVFTINATKCNTTVDSFIAGLPPKNPTVEGVTVTFNIYAQKLNVRSFFCRNYPSQWNTKYFVYVNIPNGIQFANSNAYFLYYATRVKEFNCEIDMTNVTAIPTACMSRVDYLEKIFFTPNSAQVMFDFSSAQSLNDIAIISIANGLNESATGQTLTLHATPKARCSNILGTVVLDETETYHIFTADENGTTTLTDFITNIKGWSLA